VSTARVVHAADAAATESIGAALAHGLAPGRTLHLLGDLGAGKTTLARGLLQALLPGQRVKSPTYTLVERYDAGGVPVLHLDLYRLADPEELEFLALREELGHAALLIEWPQRGGALLPPPDLVVALRQHGSGREIRLQAHGPAGEAWLASLPADLERG
jgi:tRNA threonylcarbamoyladenosine biosynthesis protein TsaE